MEVNQNGEYNKEGCFKKRRNLRICGRFEGAEMGGRYVSSEDKAIRLGELRIKRSY